MDKESFNYYKPPFKILKNIIVEVVLDEIRITLESGVPGCGGRAGDFIGLNNIGIRQKVFKSITNSLKGR